MITTAIDNGDASIIVSADDNAHDARHNMLTSASAIAAAIIGAETTLADTAKTWGQAIFRAVYVDNLNLDTMIGESKVAAGWQSLALSDAGKKAKGRLEVYFSNARLVAERWGNTEQSVRDDVLAGLSSIHYLAGQYRNADKEAKKEADKEAKRVAALEAETADAPGNEPFVSVPFADAIAHFRALLDEVTDQDMLDNGDALADIMSALTGRWNVMADKEIAASPEALAA